MKKQTIAEELMADIMERLEESDDTEYCETLEEIAGMCEGFAITKRQEMGE